METEQIIHGSIIDSWVERAGPRRRCPRLVLQVAPRGKPRELMIVEAEASLLSDAAWLDDLGANLCHGNPVAAFGRLDGRGWLAATRIDLGN
jgi:hypothetical protein